MNATTTETDRATGAQAIRNPLTPDVVERLLKRAPVAGSETRTISTPFTGEPLAEIPVGDAADVDRAFDRARFAQAAWARVPVNSRREVLHRFHDLVLTHQGQLMDVVQAETGKNRASAYEEVLHVAITGRYYGNQAEALLKPAKAHGALPVLSQTTVHHHPKGVVGVILVVITHFTSKRVTGTGVW